MIQDVKNPLWRSRIKFGLPTKVQRGVFPFFDANIPDDVAFARLRLQGGRDICDVKGNSCPVTLHVYRNGKEKTKRHNYEKANL